MDRKQDSHHDGPTEEEILAAGPLKTIQLLQRNKRDILCLFENHINRLDFLCHKYGGVVEAEHDANQDYCDKIAEFKEIHAELEHLLDTDIL